MLSIDQWLSRILFRSAKIYLALHLHAHIALMTQYNLYFYRSKNTLPLNKTMMHSSDPYMVDTITDKLFPHLTLEKAGVKSSHSTGNGSTSIQLITLKEGDKSVTLPSLCVEQNYSQMLSELVPYL